MYAHVAIMECAGKLFTIDSTDSVRTFTGSFGKVLLEKPELVIHHYNSTQWLYVYQFFPILPQLVIMQLERRTYKIVDDHQSNYHYVDVGQDVL